MRHVAPGATLLDFGCGTGLDALAYSRRGYRVLAYDNSPGMITQLRHRCQAEIAAGSIAPYSMSYPAFLENLARWPVPDAVTANFAVLNSLSDLHPFLEAIGGHLARGGCFFASLLNPLHWSKIRTAGWWRDVVRAPHGPRLHATAPYATYLHFIPETLRTARHFRLIGRANAGAHVRYDEPGEGPLFWRGETSAPNLLWHTPVSKLLGHFVFLVLRRAS